MKKLVVIAAALMLAAVVLGSVVPGAGAKPKTWKQVITMSGGDATYTGQYDSQVFRLYGGRVKLVAHVTPTVDPEYPDDPLYWSTTFFVESVEARGMFWATLSNDNGMGTDRQWTFKPPKGRCYTSPITYGCTWAYTIWEKR